MTIQSNFSLLNTLQKYERIVHNNKVFDSSGQLALIEKFKDFLTHHDLCFSRENHFGHITGSAFIVDKTYSKVLLTYHAKLKLWLQLGGHADNDTVIQNVALREAYEESGLNHLNFVNIINMQFHENDSEKENILPFDLDIHFIPQRKDEQEHYHFDVRFLLVAHDENIQISAESLDLKWIPLNEVDNYTNEVSTLRQVKTLKNLLQDKF